MGQKISRQSFSRDFKLKVMKEYYETGMSKNFLVKKYGIKSRTSIMQWEKEFPITEKALSLSSEVIKKVEDMRKKQSGEYASKEEELQARVKSLEKALQYSELRNEGLMELLKIGKEEYGLDLLKKAGAKQ